MKLDGTAMLAASPLQVWSLLNDPASLAKCLPGCERLEPDGPGRYKVTIKFGIAAISGKYCGSVLLSELRQPSSMRMRVEGKGAPGFVSGDGRIELAEQGNQTAVHYSGQAQVGGLIASVGSRMIEVAAKRIVQQFFENVAGQLRQQSAAHTASAAPGKGMAK